ncbi:MAG TPA: DUF427 domain-containing protein [Phenylobacterium sp.]
MKIPGPDHPISLERARRRWQVRFAGELIADSGAAIVLNEAHYPARVYFPRADVRMDRLVRTDTASLCPYKGDAAYYSVQVGERVAENAVWTYEAPYPAMAAIEGLVSFYPDRVEILEVAEQAASGG